jgi:methyl-accepting chemotaxis protein
MFLGFGVVLALAVALGVLAIVKMSTVNHEATTLAIQTVPAVTIANEVERQTLLTMLNMRSYALSEDEQFYKIGTEHISKIHASLAEAKKLAEQQNMEALMNRAVTSQKAVDQYEALAQQTQKLVTERDTIRAGMNAAAAKFMTLAREYRADQRKKLTEESTSGASAEALNERAGKVYAIADIIELCNSVRIEAFKAQALDDEKMITAAMPTFDKIHDAIEGTRKATKLEENLRQLDGIVVAANQYKQQLDLMLANWIKLDEIGVQRNNAATVALEEAQKSATAGMEQTKQVVDTTVISLGSASMALIVGLVVVVALGMSIAWVITRGIVKPIALVVERIKDIAQGEGDLTQRVDITSKDEVGELATWFNAFVTKVHDIVFEVSSATREVASAATEIAASNEEMASGMKEQSQQVTQVSSAIEQMSQSVVEVARKSSEAANQAQDAGKTAENGGVVVSDTIQGMTAISDAVSASATSVQELGKRGEQIGQIIEVINDIADQTNLLALNAAIEAARAGEHGRGFAVVADEVRKLADRTTKATEEIAVSIKAIQSETGQAVDRMNAGTQQVQVGVEKATQAGGSLKQIVTAATEVAKMIQSIAAATEEQSAASEQVSRNIESISAVTRQTSEATAQAAAAATQLSSKSEQLQSLVGQFKVKDSRKAA